ncbi:hypothetical protein E2C01_096439 [Portunus trituberculatus]|uniref:Uncharacterized protein n=1 Tax=Portunus trituberculatus TaxID=210409 RepID=A0A5B7JXY8_PORTR|nr:hypothetical protein [Portunus trituberculatus]
MLGFLECERWKDHIRRSTEAFILVIGHSLLSDHRYVSLKARHTGDAAASLIASRIAIMLHHLLTCAIVYLVSVPLIFKSVAVLSYGLTVPNFLLAFILVLSTLLMLV